MEPNTHQASPESLSQMRGPLKKSCCMCCGLFLVAALILFILILSTLAKTGLWNIPFFSRFFTPPTIERIIEPQAFDPEKYVQTIAASNYQAIQNGNVITLTLSENELTYLIQQEFSAHTPSTSPTVQTIRENFVYKILMVDLKDNNEFTLYGHFVPKDNYKKETSIRNIYATINGTIQANTTSDSIDIDFTHITIGEVSLPGPLLRNANNTLDTALNAAFNNKGFIQSIRSIHTTENNISFDVIINTKGL